MTAVLLAALLAPAAEPEFAGRPLSAWVKQLREDDTPRRRRAAALALGQLGAANPETLPVVLPALGRAARQDASPDVRRQAVAGVAQQKPDEGVGAVADLTEALRAEKEPAVRLELATALGRFGPPAAPAVAPLTACLSADDPRLRAAAAAALGRVGGEASAAAPALLARLSDADRGVQRAVVAALGTVKPADPAAAAAGLVKLLDKADADLRLAVLDAVGRLGDPTPATLDAVTAALKHADVPVRLTAARTLARFGPSAAAARPAVEAVAKADASAAVREACLRAAVVVGAADPAPLVSMLAERLFADAAVEVRVATADLLGGFGTKAASAAPNLRRAQSDADPRVRQAATTALKLVVANR